MLHVLPSVFRSLYSAADIGTWTIMLALVFASISPAAAANRFQGPDARLAAGSFINTSLTYDQDYDPGYLLLRYLDSFPGPFMTNVRFSPSAGHQVIMGKSNNEDDVLAGGQCASFQIVVERFDDQTLEGFAKGRVEQAIMIESADRIHGVACRIGKDDYSVEVRRVSLDVAERRKAFNTPFGGPSGGN